MTRQDLLNRLQMGHEFIGNSLLAIWILTHYFASLIEKGLEIGKIGEFDTHRGISSLSSRFGRYTCQSQSMQATRNEPTEGLEMVTLPSKAIGSLVAARRTGAILSAHSANIRRAIVAPFTAAKHFSPSSFLSDGPAGPRLSAPSTCSRD